MILFGLGLLELLFVSVFFLLLIVGVTFDRRGKEDVKWWIFGVGLMILAVWQWSSWSFGGIWEAVKTVEFWSPIGYYLLAGLVYSALEFFLDIRRSARFYAAEWQQHLKAGEQVPVLGEDGEPVVTKKGDRFNSDQVQTTRRSNSEVYDEVKAKGANSGLFNTAMKLTSEFVGRYHFKHRIIELKIGTDKISVEPRVNKIELADHISAWTFLWPAYAVSLILGDLVVEVFNFIASVLAKISGQFVKLSFANVFKF